MESEEGEEMEVVTDVVVIPIRDQRRQSQWVYTAQMGLNWLRLPNVRRKSMEMKSFFIVMSVVHQRALRES